MLLIMLKCLLLLSYCCTAVWSVPHERRLYDLKLADQLFENFVTVHQKQYENEHERQIRFGIFKDNLDKINKHNIGSKTALFGINKFTDLTLEEVHQKYTGFSYMTVSQGCPVANLQEKPIIPFDWRDHNKVTRVKDQGHCGSCWAFSAVANLESQYAIGHHELKEFSEQQLVDCDTIDKGCDGGFMDYAFNWIRKNGGIESEEDYPYTGKEGKCSFDKTKVQATVSQCISINATDENVLHRALTTFGPLSIAVHVNEEFASYKGGILDKCEGQSLNHGLLLVGNGIENNTEYWIIKNSWGEDWGEKGYIRVQMHKNCCRLADYVVTAIVD